MQTTSVFLGAAGASQWIPVDSHPKGISISLANTIQSGSTLTYKNQYSYDDLSKIIPVNISRVTTVATVTIPSHNVVVGDSLTIEGAGAPFDGTFAVASVVDANTVTFTVPDSGLAAATGRCLILRVFDHPTVTGKTANFDGTITTTVSAVRLNITAYTGGGVTLTVAQG